MIEHKCRTCTRVDVAHCLGCSNYSLWEEHPLIQLGRKDGVEQVLALVRFHAGKCKESEIRELLEAK